MWNPYSKNDTNEPTKQKETQQTEENEFMAAGGRVWGRDG